MNDVWNLLGGFYFVLRTTSVSPLDRDKDRVLDPRKMHSHFSAFDGGMIMLFTERMNVCKKV